MQNGSLLALKFGVTFINLALFHVRRLGSVYLLFLYVVVSIVNKKFHTNASIWTTYWSFSTKIIICDKYLRTEDKIISKSIVTIHYFLRFEVFYSKK